MLAVEEFEGILAKVDVFMKLYYPDRRWFVGGGFLRDFFYGVPYKDVDVFVRGFDTDAMPEGAEDFGDCNAYLHHCVTEEYRGIEINLIFFRGDFWTLEMVAERNDCGPCQISWCPVEDRMYRTPLFDEDFQNGTCTVDRDTRREHISRVAEKIGAVVLNPLNYAVDDARKGWFYNPATSSLQRKSF